MCQMQTGKRFVLFEFVESKRFAGFSSCGRLWTSRSTVNKEEELFVYFLTTKGQVFEAYEDFKAMEERQSERKLRIMQTDNGTEFVNSMVSQYCSNPGQRHWEDVK